MGPYKTAQTAALLCLLRNAAVDEVAGLHESEYFFSLVYPGTCTAAAIYLPCIDL